MYADVPLLTARPTDLKNIPHYLYGVLNAFEQGTTARWLQMVAPVLEEVENPILVGGSGLYIKCLIDGISPIPAISPQTRERVRQMTSSELKRIIPDFPFTDTQRLSRAAEVFLETGKSIEYWQQQPRQKVFDGDFKTILILPKKEKLYAQCNYRFTQMIQKGALKEVVSLMEKNPARSGGVFKAIGVQELMSYIDGLTSLDDAIKQAQQATRNYAKRQETWFKHQIKTDIVLQESSKDAFKAIQSLL